MTAVDQLLTWKRAHPALFTPSEADRHRPSALDLLDLLELLLQSLRNEYAIFGRLFCEHCGTFGPDVTGTFHHAPDCLIGQALDRLDQEGR